VMRTSRGVLRVRSRRATLASLLPWRGAVTRGHSLEWGPQKPITIPRPQLCSWNARRELYQHVGNFVGSVASPVLANLALDGLERRLKEHFPKPHAETTDRRKVHMVRYADDFIITGTSKELLEGEVKPFVEQFM